jgi:PBP1b-binding outer membrane lipoprotein LpoB
MKIVILTILSILMFSGCVAMNAHFDGHNSGVGFSTKIGR